MLEALQTLLSFSLVFVTLRVATPLILAAIGGLFTDLAGVINVALEGLMLISALIGVMVGTFLGSPWIGLAAGVLSATLLSLALAYFHLKLKTDIIIAGIALNLFSSGFTVFLMDVITGERGNFTRSETIPLPNIAMPFLDGIPLIGEPLSLMLNGPNGAGLNVLTYAAIVVAVLAHVFLYRTPLGLRLRAVGENPHAAESVGINVVRMQYFAIILSGVFAGMAGAFLSLGYTSQFIRNMTAGRGFIALAAVLLGGRSPYGTLLAALFFGLAEGIGVRLQTFRLPPQLVFMIPYAMTIVALVVFARRQQRRAAQAQAASEEA